jgi:hypothetical protein
MVKTLMKTEGWAIYGTCGFYTGWWHTRAEAMYAHCQALDKGWAYCRKKGDRAVRVSIKEVPSKSKNKVIKSHTKKGVPS